MFSKIIILTIQTTNHFAILNLKCINLYLLHNFYSDKVYNMKSV
jgi:hypothetical protein